MSKYIKKPIAVEALEWTGKNLKEILNFTGIHYSARLWTDAEFEMVVRDEGLKIFTLEGSYKATVGDMIIKGVAGEVYPCKPDIFKKTYYTEEEYAAL